MKPEPQSLATVHGNWYLYAQVLWVVVVHCSGVGVTTGQSAPSGQLVPEPALHAVIITLWHTMSAPHSFAVPFGSQALGTQALTSDGMQGGGSQWVFGAQVVVGQLALIDVSQVKPSAHGAAVLQLCAEAALGNRATQRAP
ncbi:MAG TPA: hypothetical protein VL137_15055 [Polyangiaceae bacterium]|nr:hypothetical protein [Polyangiaceae bacterium]